MCKIGGNTSSKHWRTWRGEVNDDWDGKEDQNAIKICAWLRVSHLEVQGRKGWIFQGKRLNA